MLNDEYGCPDGPTFSFEPARSLSLVNQLRFEKAIDDLWIYNDFDPGLYDWPPSQQTLERAHYARLAQEWNDWLTERVQRSSGGPDGGVAAVPQPSTNSTAPPAAGKPVANRETFTIEYGGRECPLGNTMEFALFERLSQRPGIYLSISVLINEVWTGRNPETNTIQKTVSTLKKKLRDAGMESLTIDGSNKGHYSLIPL
jgi:hypothetical protein